MIKVKTTGSPAGIYFYLHNNIVIYIGEGVNVFKRANVDIEKKIGNQKFDQIKYITEDTFYWLSDERFRKYYETRWIYKFKNTVVNVNKHRPPTLGHFLEKMFLWDYCPESQWLSPTTTRRDFAYQNTFKDRSRWHVKGTNWAPNFYPKTWLQNLDYNKPLYVDGKSAFKFLVKPNFKYEDIKKPMSKKFKGQKQFLKNIQKTKIFYQEDFTMIKHPMVLVTWYDAKDGQTGWHSVTDVQKEPLAVCHSMGWMVTHNETKTVIMADYSKYDAEQDGGRHIAIPTGWVKSIAYLDITYRENENGHG